MPKKKTKSQVNDSIYSNQDQSSNDSIISELKTAEIPEKFSVLLCGDTKLREYDKYLTSAWKNIVFMHPKVLRYYGIYHHILISGENKTALSIALPGKFVKKSSIYFPKENCNFQADELVAISKYENEIRNADEIFILFRTKITVTQNILEIIFLTLCHRFIYNGLRLQFTVFDRSYQFEVKNVISYCDFSDLNLCEKKESDSFYTVSHNTTINVEKVFSPCKNNLTFAKIGGLKQQLSAIQNCIKLFMNSENDCLASGGVLMFEGESGTGKSLVLEAIYDECNINVEKIVWFDILTRSQLEVKEMLETTFRRAIQSAPSFIIIDDFNYLCPHKDKSASIQIYASKILSYLIKDIENAQVLVIVATNEADKSVKFDESVLNSLKKLKTDVKFNTPTTLERVDILNKILTSKKHNLSADEIEKCANIAHSFTGKDFINAIRDAELISSSHKLCNNSNVYLEDETINYENLKIAIKLKKPSMVSSGNLKVKKVQWTDIGGMDKVKEKLKELVEWPLKHPEAFRRFNIIPPRGVLLYGPPGCSKTMIAKALATECDLNFISKNISDLFNKYVGESEKAVRDLFALAKSKAPCIIFLDEIDALVSERGRSSGSSGVNDRITTTLLTELDGVEELHGVVIIAATNRPDMIDDALVRSGRINHFIYVPLPDDVTREKILRISMQNRNLSEDFNFKYVALKTEGYSGAEIVNICSEAAFQLLEENPTADNPVFYMHHFEKALQSVLPRTSKESIQYYEDFYRKHSSK